MQSNLLRIGIFYDGNYFYHVSNYYCYAHARRARLSISGLHEFIRRLAALYEDVKPEFCQIVDCHYFRGRLPAQEANSRQILYKERVFDDILMNEGVVTHYLPMLHGGEKGVDVSLALEALELTIFKKFDIVVLITSDGDYVPLVRKLNALGTRVMVLGWEFSYQDVNGSLRSTTTSARIMSEVPYPIWMHEIIDGHDPRFDSETIDSLFVPAYYREQRYSSERMDENESDGTTGEYSENNGGEFSSGQEGEISVGSGEAKRYSSTIVQLKGGYGFLSNEPNPRNLFFYREDLEDVDYADLRIGDVMEYEIGRNDRGECAKRIRRIAEAPSSDPSLL